MINNASFKYLANLTRFYHCQILSINLFIPFRLIPSSLPYTQFIIWAYGHMGRKATPSMNDPLLAYQISAPNH